MIVDAHHHFWSYRPEEFGWIGEDMSVLRRDFLAADLHAEIAAAGVQAVVSVQARQTLEETRWLLDIASRNGFVAGVVGWVPLLAPNVDEVLEEFADHDCLKGVRHVVQDEPDEFFQERDDFNRGVRQLLRHDLVYDVLVHERHLPQTVAFVRQHEEQRFVLDHIGKPRIRDGMRRPWANSIRELSREENVWCKLSGMVSEADRENWTVDQLRYYMDTVLESFGPDRVMFGSDWPVCLVACDYARWLGIVKDVIAELSEDEQASILGRSAVAAYKL
ncbi:MAG: amidohydrolase family protein [Lentisphaeria bacterium]|nr:amidohydrolase family protein [Lentisphaeria bacterium]